MDKPPSEQYVGKVDSFTASEIAALQVNLDKQLGPEYISNRPQGGGQVSYLEAGKAFNIANEVFGFHRWSTQIIRDNVDFVDHNKESGRYNVGITVHVRITLQNGVFREDYGYGSIDNCQSKAKAFEKAKKEGVSDAMKRALRQFGNVLGNCLYDKQYLQQVHRVKKENSSFNADRLYRGPEYRLQTPAESITVRNGANPNEADHANRGVEDNREHRAATDDSGDFRGSDNYGGDDLDLVDFFPIPQDSSLDERADGMKEITESAALDGSPFRYMKQGQASKFRGAQDNILSSTNAVDEKNVPAAFYSAKIAADVQNNAPLPPEAHYDASRLSPFIGRSANVNPDRSTPITRRQTEAARSVTLNGVTPQRLVGMPPVLRQPIANYKAPSTVKRPIDAVDGYENVRSG